ncbi:MAG: nitroreductase family deazaflavin-dependent oxidoreductase [Actinomycetota bacterium]
MPEARPADLADEDFCYVTTTGRRSGRLHTIEIWFAAAGNTVYLLSGGGERADWIRNLRAEPRVGLRIAGEEWEARARVVTDNDEDARVRCLLAAKYQDWREGQPLSGWARTALPVAIEVSR